MTRPEVLVFAGLLGVALGSFLNVCVLRWPRGASVVRPRSRCPACSQRVRWYDQIPVVSWLLLGARCRSCRASLSLRYPLVEIAAAAICVAMAETRGVSVNTAGESFFLLVLLGCALTDARDYLIPDRFSLGGAGVGLALALAPGGITPEAAFLGAASGFGGMWLVGEVGTRMITRIRPGRLEAAAREHVGARRREGGTWARRLLGGTRGRLAAFSAGAVAVPAAFWSYGPATAVAALAGFAAAAAVVVAWLEGLEAGEDGEGPGANEPLEAVVGGGDVKMMLLVGAFTGPSGIVLTVFLAALSGVAVYFVLRLLLGAGQLIPFGVFLAAVAAASLLWGEALISWYAAFVGLPLP